MRSSDTFRNQLPDENLLLSLSKGLTDRYGDRFTVTTDGHGQRWRLHLLTGAYFADSPAAETRRRLADQFRYTPFALRRAPQYLIGSAAAFRPLLSVASTDGFVVDPEIPAASWKLFFPGSRRIRLFDYASGFCRTMLRQGIDQGVIVREIELRGDNRKGPFVNINDGDTEAGWFTEPIFDGYNLARLPVKYDFNKLQATAYEQLREWQQPQRKKEKTSAYLGKLVKKIDAIVSGFEFLPDCGGMPLTDAARKLAQTAGEINAIYSAPAHGDLQPGNIMVSRTGDRVILVDFEFAGRRFEHYDLFTLALGSRWEGQLVRNASRYLRRRDSLRLLSPLDYDKQNRRAALALFLLEDLLFYLAESAIKIKMQPSPGLIEFSGQLQKLSRRKISAGILA